MDKELKIVFPKISLKEWKRETGYSDINEYIKWLEWLCEYSIYGMKWDTSEPFVCAEHPHLPSFHGSCTVEGMPPLNRRL